MIHLLILLGYVAYIYFELMALLKYRMVDANTNHI